MQTVKFEVNVPVGKNETPINKYEELSLQEYVKVLVSQFHNKEAYERAKQRSEDGKFMIEIRIPGTKITLKTEFIEADEAWPLPDPYEFVRK